MEVVVQLMSAFKKFFSELLFYKSFDITFMRNKKCCQKINSFFSPMDEYDRSEQNSYNNPRKGLAARS